MVTLLFVNGEKKGDVFVWRNEDGDFLLRVEDLKEAGLGETAGTVTMEGGESHVSLRSIAGISFTFDEKNSPCTLQPSLRCFPALSSISPEDL